MTNMELDAKCAEAMEWKRDSSRQYFDANGRWAASDFGFGRWSPSTKPDHAALLRERLAECGHDYAVECNPSMALVEVTVDGHCTTVSYGRDGLCPNVVAAECRATAEAFVAAMASKEGSDR